MKETKQEMVTRELKNIRAIQRNPVGLYKGGEVGQMKVMAGIAESALGQLKKK